MEGITCGWKSITFQLKIDMEVSKTTLRLNRLVHNYYTVEKYDKMILVEKHVCTLGPYGHIGYVLNKLSPVI